MKKKLAAIVAAGALLLGASACSYPGGPSEPTELSRWRTTSVPLPDGRVVECVSYDGGSYDGGISCDWSRAR